jgi:hypothetical protein
MAAIGTSAATTDCGDLHGLRRLRPRFGERGWSWWSQYDRPGGEAFSWRPEGIR